jgi:hypothetical protein
MLSFLPDVLTSVKNPKSPYEVEPALQTGMPKMSHTGMIITHLPKGRKTGTSFHSLPRLIGVTSEKNQKHMDN